MITDWVKALTVDGVPDPTTGGHLKVCCFYLLNLHLSSVAILNACSDSLKQAIEQAIPNEEQRVGLLVYFNVICKVQPLSHSQTRVLADKLQALDLRKNKGENMTQFQSKAMAIIDKIYMLVLDESTIPKFGFPFTDWFARCIR